MLTDSGLGFINRRGRAQDAFRARVLFPICDPSGRPVALGGRILPPRPGRPPPERPEPKYKNSQETAIYSKRRTLYALNWAKQDVIAQGEVVVCEGYTDVIGFFQAGVPRAVATCGTALAEEHFTLLRNFGRRIVLAYDADGAGQSATSRVYEWERRHEVDVVVADLPSGSDPGDLARSDPAALARAVAEARPFLQFRVDRILGAERPDHRRGPRPGRRVRPDAPWPNTPTTWSVTSTSCSSRTAAGSTPPDCGSGSSTCVRIPPGERPRHGAIRSRSPNGRDAHGDPGELRDPDEGEGESGRTGSRRRRPRCRRTARGSRR